MAEPPEPLKDRKFYTALGVFTASWATAEFALDMWVGMVHEFGGGAALEAARPLNFKRKVKFLRRCHRDLPALAGWNDTATDILDTFVSLSEKRHDLIHGIQRRAADKSGVIEYHRLIPDPFGPETYKTFELSYPYVARLARVTADLGHLTTDTLNELANLLMPSHKVH